MLMSLFQGLKTKIQSWEKDPEQPLRITGLDPLKWVLFLTQSAEPHQSYTLVLNSQDEIEKCERFLREANLTQKILTFPGLETNPYLSLIASESGLLARFSTLNWLANSDEACIVLTSVEGLGLKLPPVSFFQQNGFKIEVSDVVGPDELAGQLVRLGYSSSTSVEEPGTFVKKGEIFDIYPISGQPVRLHYFDDMIEEIFAIDLDTQKTRREDAFNDIYLGAGPGILTESQYSNTLRENIPMPAPAYKNKFEQRKFIFSHLQDGQLFESYPYFLPLFFDQQDTLSRFTQKRGAHHFCFLNYRECETGYSEYQEELREDYERVQTELESDNLLPEPSQLYLNPFSEFLKRQNANIFIDELDIDALDDEFSELKTHLNIENSKVFLGRQLGPSQKKNEYVFKALQLIQEQFEHSGRVIFCLKHDSTQSQIERLMEQAEYPNSLKTRIVFLKLPLDHGFFYENEKVLYIAEADLFAPKQDKLKGQSQKQIDLFAEQLSTLKVGDYVIHTEHGTGQYLGLESHDFGGTTSDYLVLKYAEGDKVYVPVYKLNLIQKHAGEGANLKPESLRTNKFAGLKTKARQSAKKLAFDLLRLQAERQSASAYAFNPPDDYYHEFERSFAFEETPDQTYAIQNVLEAMQKPVPMDYLVCGDVGFGKTEVAMRAAFKAIQDKKQVAVLVPTTVLALQHFTSFTSRFKDFPVKIEFLSRFKSAKETKEIKEAAENGEIDILIGTHKLLSSSMKFHDLGLVVVDEEQRFGVGHKEKLKLLKTSVDFLTLTATPIPRTLQLAFLGIRDMSLIRTPPPKRQSIKTYLIKEDDLTIQSALKKELQRGGQAFIVHNKVKDIESYTASIRELIPEAKILYAHGQLPEKELENRMKAFYSGEYQVLISTTIIESGIDIPNANTMIVDRADTYGLSQLHQLRGRIGRSDKKAYAYLVVPKFKALTPVAEKRLKALQTYADIGSGFNIASCDLEIRGAGDILGASQSGHIEAVGLELYMDLLKDAIQEIRGEKKIVKKDIEVSTPHPAYIPNMYIPDSSQRLKYYKRLSNCNDHNELESLKEEMTDVFGMPSDELNNLFSVLAVRLNLQNLGVKNVQVAGTLIRLGFEKSLLESNEELRNSIVEFFVSRPKKYQISPDFKVSYTHKEEVSPSILVEFSREIAEQILPC